MILINASTRDGIKMFQPFHPIFLPIGLGYIAGVADAEGIKNEIVDEQIETNTFDVIAEHVERLTPPYLFGFSVVTATFKRALAVAERLKAQYPDSIICFGGHHPTAMPEEVLAYPHIDIVVRGEGERIIPSLYRTVKARRDYSQIPNISFKTSGGVKHNNVTAVINDLDSIPPFPYHRFQSPKYNLGVISSSRGCPYKCIFCGNREAVGPQYRFRTPDSVIADIELLHSKFNVRHINFLDDNFLLNKKRVYSLLAGIRKKGLHKELTFAFQTRGDNADEKVLREMYATGFKVAFIGLETGSEALMKRIKKGETVAQVVATVKLAKKIGFYVSGAFIYALPGESHNDRMECLRLSKALELNIVRFNNATPYPGTELYEIAKSEGRLRIQGLYENFNAVSTFIENPFNKIPFSYVPEGNSEAEIRRDILFSYLAFFLDPKKLKTMFVNPKQNAGMFSVGEKTTEIIRRLPALMVLFCLLSIKFSQLLINIMLNSKIPISAFIGHFRGKRVIRQTGHEM